MQASQIVVYLDEGVDPHSFRLIVRSVRKAMPGYFVRSINRSFFDTEHWEAETKLIIFPGGRDVPYDQALRGERNRRIRQYIENGGRYLGICAGGYYGSARIIFGQGGDLEVTATRELSFFSGAAVGPIYGPGQFQYNSMAGARIAKVAWDHGVSPVFFNGGCAFVEGGKERVLATYDDLDGNLPAAVLCPVKKGQAVLVGVHPEYDARGTPETLRDEIEVDSEGRKAFWTHILEHALN